jgi:hypothetical protein
VWNKLAIHIHLFGYNAENRLTNYIHSFGTMQYVGELNHIVILFPKILI